jgi:hypothetical protein
VRWFIPIIPTLRRLGLRQENLEFEGSLAYKAIPSQKTKRLAGWQNDSSGRAPGTANQKVENFPNL